MSASTEHDRSAAALVTLLGLLRQEQAALVTGQIDLLGALTAQKAESLAVLENAAVTRAAALPPKLRQLGRVARELNRINGHLIAQRRGEVNAALAVLLSSAPGNTYGRDGQAHPNGAPRLLGAA
jgi:flagellar biosynthesis/type III secretory pathway chaperone